MATYELKWEEDLQAYVYTPQTYGGKGGAVTGKQIIIKEADLPANAQVINYDKELDRPLTIKVSKSFIDSKKLPDKDVPSTLKEYRKAQADALNTLPDGSPLSPTKFEVDITRKDVMDENNILLDAGLVVYIDPNNKEGGKQSVVLKPGTRTNPRPGGPMEETIVAVSAEKEIQDIYYAAAALPNGLKELKDKLYYGGFYEAAGMTNAQTSRSLAAGNNADNGELLTALSAALQTQTSQNWALIKGNKKPLVLDDWLEEGKAAFLGTNSNKTVNMPNELNAKEKATNAFRRFTGRNPTDNEVLAVLAAINEAALQNPDITTTDLSKYPNTSINKQGFNETELNQFVEDYAKTQPGAEEYNMEQGALDTFSGAMNLLVNDLRQERQMITNPGDIK
jgi:hypothetical protein